MNVGDLYKRSKVKRWHVWDIPIVQTTAEHSAGVAMIIIALHKNPSANLLKAAIYHDLHEYDLGDISYEAKTRYPELEEIDKAFEKQFIERIDMVDDLSLTDAERDWLTFADMTESFLFLNNASFVLSEELSLIKTKACGILVDLSYKLTNKKYDNIIDHLI